MRENIRFLVFWARLTSLRMYIIDFDLKILVMFSFVLEFISNIFEFCLAFVKVVLVLGAKILV
jgi:hypothetical protein